MLFILVPWWLKTGSLPDFLLPLREPAVRVPDPLQGHVAGRLHGRHLLPQLLYLLLQVGGGGQILPALRAAALLQLAQLVTIRGNGAVQLGDLEVEAVDSLADCAQLGSQLQDVGVALPLLLQEYGKLFLCLNSR